MRAIKQNKWNNGKPLVYDPATGFGKTYVLLAVQKLWAEGNRVFGEAPKMTRGARVVPTENHKG